MQFAIGLMLAAVLGLGSLVGACSNGGSNGSSTDPGCDPACGSGEVCVVFYDGQCNLFHRQCVTSSCGLECDTTPGGANGLCTNELCGAGWLGVQDAGIQPFTCGEPCGTEPADTFRCYGP